MTVLASIRWIGRRVTQIAMLVGVALATTWASATEPDFVAVHARAVKANPGEWTSRSGWLPGTRSSASAN